MSQPAISRGVDLFNNWYRVAEAWLLTDKRALHGVALARILSGCTIAGILITNFRVRDVLFGPGSAWAAPVQDRSEYWPPGLVESLGTTAFLLYYLAAIAFAILWTLGWRTRLVGPLMLISEVSIVERNPVVGDQGDNILRIGLLLLLFMHTSEYWSLDARRRRRTVAVPMNRGVGSIVAVTKNLWRSHQVLPRWFTNGVHNVFLAALMFQLVVIYISAGMFKVQGSYWQHGTALYYPLQLQEFKPFPFLTDAMTHYGVMVGLATYVVVFTQLYFPVLLLNVITRRIAIALVILFHLSIAVMMALPWFSLAMIAFDAVWVSTATYVLLDTWIRDKLRSVANRFRASPTVRAEEPSLVASNAD